MKKLTSKIIFAFLFAGVGSGLYAEDQGMQQANSAKQFVVIVHNENPIESLSQQEIKQIFLGRLRRFPGVDQDMNVMDLAASSETHTAFYEKVIHMAPDRLKRYRARYLFSGQGRLPKVVDSQDALLAAIAKDNQAIGYVSLDKGSTLPDKVRVVFEYLAE